MLRTGRVLLHSNNDEILYFVWYRCGGSFERVDLIDNMSAYSSINTLNCRASYVKKVKEHTYGDIGLIRQLFKIEHEASVLLASEEKNIRFEDGHFIMEVTKQSDTGVKYFNKMVDGIVEYQEYTTDIGTVVIDSINMRDNNTITPINIDAYDVIEIDRSSGKTVRSVRSEWYSYEELLRKYPQVKHVLDPINDYKVIRSYEEAEERLKIWAESKVQLKSFDIESYSTEWGPFSDNRITGVFLGFGEHWSTYFPFRQENFKYNLPIEFLQKILDTINNQPKYPEVILLAHNVKFEIQGFYQEFRKYVRFDVDTFQLAVLADPVVKKNTHTLKTLTGKVDNRFYLSLNHIFIGKVQFNVLDEETVLLYGCPDATSPAKIYPYLLNKIPKDEYAVMGLEMQLPIIKAHEEFYGMYMDMEYLTKVRSDLEADHEMLAEMFRRIHHTSSNINSPVVLREILYDKLRCKVEVWTDKGLPSTSKVAIQRIVDTGVKDIKEGEQIPSDIISSDGSVLIKGEELAKNKYPSLVIYRKYKLLEKDLLSMRRLEKKSDHGFFKFYINQSGAGSNRQTSDAHQFSSKMKRCSIPDPGHTGFVSCDFSQVELRILAAMAKAEKLLEKQRDPDIDIHRAVWSIISKKPEWDISEEERKSIKSLNFGVVYKMTEYGLARSKYGPKFTKTQLATEAQNITDFYNGLPEVKEFQMEVEENLLRDGYVKTAFNYYRYYPELLDPMIDPKLKSKLIKSANNTPVQGTGAQILKIVEVLVWNYIQKKGWDRLKDYGGILLPIARMVLPIHDEILFTFDEEEISKEEVTKMFKECMELDIKGFPPLFANPAFISNWADGKNSAYELDHEFRDKVVSEYEKGNYLLTGKDYLKTLTDYRNSTIQKYMNDLIHKWKTPDEIVAHVTHPSLTHTLIETMMPDSAERKQYTHRERIAESVKRYIDSLVDGGKVTVVSKNTDDEENPYESVEFNEWIEKNSYIDENGDLIEEEDEEEEKDERFDFDRENENEFMNIKSRPYVYCMSEVFVDISDLDIKTEGEFLHSEIMKYVDSSNPYTLYYVQGDRQVKTKYKLDYIPKELDRIFDSISQGGLIKNGI